VTATPAPVRAQGTCTVCGRSVDLLPGGDRVRAHGNRRVRRQLTAEERFRDVSPYVWRGRCPGKHKRKTETTEA
jgi:hypothetical protein